MASDQALLPFDVSRETSERLEIYFQLLKKWNPVINLVSASTMTDAWKRHFVDSSLAYLLIRERCGVWLDFGSGGGFPGAVLAILAHGDALAASVNCIEADIRKCEFLRTVSRRTNVPFGVISRRIEDAPPQRASVVTARALTSLTKLLELASSHLEPSGIAVFHKGSTWQSELEEAQRTWRFQYETTQSKTSADSVLLTVGDLQRA